MLVEMKGIFGIFVVVFFILVFVEVVKKCMKIDFCCCLMDIGEINFWSFVG